MREGGVYSIVYTFSNWELSEIEILVYRVATKSLISASSLAKDIGEKSVSY